MFYVYEFKLIYDIVLFSHSVSYFFIQHHVFRSNNITMSISNYLNFIYSFTGFSINYGSMIHLYSFQFQFVFLMEQQIKDVL